MFFNIRHVFYYKGKRMKCKLHSRCKRTDANVPLQQLNEELLFRSLVRVLTNKNKNLQSRINLHLPSTATRIWKNISQKLIKTMQIFTSNTRGYIVDQYCVNIYRYSSFFSFHLVPTTGNTIQCVHRRK